MKKKTAKYRLVHSKKTQETREKGVESYLVVVDLLPKIENGPQKSLMAAS